MIKKPNGECKKDPIISRPFYFDEVNDVHFKRFAKKFVSDENYRNICIEKTVRWARLSNWYDYNSDYYYDLFQTIHGTFASNKIALKKMREQSDITYKKCNELYNILNKKLEWLESTNEYKAHLEQQSSMPVVDPKKIDLGIEKAVLLFNRIPEVKTRFSCQGSSSNGIIIKEWEYGKIFFPGKHQLYSHISFERIPKEISATLDKFLLEKNVGRCLYNKAFSFSLEKNNGFIKLLEEFAIDNCKI